MGVQGPEMEEGSISSCLALGEGLTSAMFA